MAAHDGYDCGVTVDWEDINLQDEVEEAKVGRSTCKMQENSSRKTTKRRENEHGSEKREQRAQNSMVTREELAIINRFTKRALKEDEEVHLCRAAVRQRGGQGRRALPARDA